MTFPSIAGTGVEAIQAYVAGKTGVDVGDVDARAMHQYVSEHYTEFDISGPTTVPIPCWAAQAMTSSSARVATTTSMGARAMTSCSAAAATTP